MRVLLVAFSVDGAFGVIRSFERALRKLGHEVRFEFVADETKWSFGKTLKRGVAVRVANALSDRALRLRRRIFEQRISDQMVRAIREFRPDFVLTSKGFDLSDDFFAALAETRTPIINYFTDPPPYEKVDYMKRIGRFSAVVTYGRFFVPAWQWFNVKSFYVPFGADLDVHKPTAIPAGKEAYYASPVAYLATWQPHAERWPELLASHGLKLWGNQWHRIQSPGVVQSWQGEGQGTNAGLPIVCGAADVIFNVVRPHNGTGCSMKTFEIPACRGFMLTNRTDEQVEYFPEDEGAAYFSSDEELVDKLRFYLGNASAREKIAARGFELAQSHGYDDRARRIIDIVDQVHV